MGFIQKYTKHIFLLLLVNFLFILHNIPLFASESQSQHNIIIIPTAQTQKSQERLISSLLAQKLFLSFINISSEEGYTITFGIIDKTINTKNTKIVEEYIEQDYHSAIILNTRYKSKGVYEISVEIFYMDNIIEKRYVTTFTTTLQKTLNGSAFTDATSKKIFNAIKSSTIEIIEEYPITDLSTIHINTTKNQNTYQIRLNGTLIKKESPTMIFIRKSHNFIEIVERNNENEEVITNSFFIRPIMDKYEVSLTSKKELPSNKDLNFIKKTAFLNSIITTDLLFGYSYLLFLGDSFNTRVSNSPHMLNSIIRLGISPKVPFLKLGLEVPFFSTIWNKEKPIDSFIGVSANISGVFPIASNTEFTIHAGGGALFKSTIQKLESLGTSHKLVILPQASAGISFAYNIPVPSSAYIRIILDTSAMYAIFPDIEQKIINNRLKRINKNNSMLFLNTSLGIGVRY